MTNELIAGERRAKKKLNWGEFVVMREEELEDKRRERELQMGNKVRVWIWRRER